MTDVSEKRRRNGRPAKARRAAEGVVRRIIVASGYAGIIVLALITVFLVLNSLKAIGEVGLWQMVTGTDWYPTSKNPQFGFLPAEVGSLWITGVALILCVPVGILAAIFISEFAGRRTKELAKSVIEFMAAVPSVVLGLIGTALLVPWVRETFGLDTGLTGFTAGVVVGVMALPTVISIAEDAMHAVPKDLRTGSYALGNNRWQTTYKVVVPAASSGIFAAVMLGLGRAIGETMVVLMLAGNSGIIPDTPFVSMRAMPSTIAGETAEVVQGGLHYSALFTMALVLFAITFTVNLAADIVLERQRRRWRR